MPRGALAAALLLAAEVFCARTARATAAFSLIDGEVQQRAGRNDPWTAPTRGALLPDGAELRTGPAGRAELVFDDGSLLELGSATAATLKSSSSARRVLSLASGFIIGKFAGQDAVSVLTPFGAVSAEGARFLIEAGKESERVRLFDGQAAIKQGKAKEVPVLEGRSVEASNAGVVQRGGGSLTSFAGTPWMIEPPRGYALDKDEAGLPVWKRAWQETVGPGGAAAFTVRHLETVVFAVEEVDWQEGQPWPQDCRRANAAGSAVARGPVRRERVAGLPAFSYTCVVPGGLKYQDRTSGQPVWKISPGELHRYRDIAVDYNGRGAGHALWARYSHVEDVADIPGLGPDQMDQVRRLIGMTAGADRDGPGANAFLESLETLRPPLAEQEERQERGQSRSEGKPERDDEPAAVPLLR